MTKRSLTIFFALAFLLGWLCQGLAIMSGVTGSGRNWLMAAMWTPLLAGCLAGQAPRRRLWAKLRRGGFHYWPIALLAGWSFSIIQQLLLWLTRAGHWNYPLFQLNVGHKGVQAVHHLAMVLGVGPQRFGVFALNLLVSVTLGSLVSMLLGAIGEEAGWRALLQPSLADHSGFFKGTLLVGLIWGYWHLPVNLAGYNDAQHPLLQALLIFQIHTVAMSFVLAWLVERTGSVWPAALAHGANNTLQSGPLIVASGWLSDQMTAVSASLIVGGAVALLIQRQKLRSAGKHDPSHMELITQSSGR